MPYCGRCGFQVTEEMQYRPNCEVSLKTQPLFQSGATSTEPTVFKRTTPFLKGIIIGLGAGVLFGSLFGGFFLNFDYWRLQAIFLANGATLKESRNLLSSTVSSIWFCAELAVIGIYFLAMGMLSHFSPSARVAMDNMSMRASSGTALLTSGIVILGGGSVQYAIRNVYSPEAFLIWPITIFGIGSIAFILSGIYLLITTQRSQS